MFERPEATPSSGNNRFSVQEHRTNSLIRKHEGGSLNARAHHSQTTPSSSPSRMYRYAGCDLGTRAIPCCRAYAQVILPFPLRSLSARASSPPAVTDPAPTPEEAGTEQTRWSISVLSHPERMRSSACTSCRSIVSLCARRSSTTRPANQHRFRPTERLTHRYPLRFLFSRRVSRWASLSEDVSK